jgi:hypothetical protein
MWEVIGYGSGNPYRDMFDFSYLLNNIK